MDTYKRSTRFRYNPNSSTTMRDADADSEGILEIFVHHARNIHNICIYEKQDVYAKFSLTYNPDEVISTRIINGGGRNPDFNETLRMKVDQLDSVLKCEIWMFSRARNLMEDQLLGFALVPISRVVGKGKVTQNYSLSSTDLFHSPAGTVQLTLSLHTSNPGDTAITSFSKQITSSITSEVVLLDQRISEVISDPVEFSRIEFPDINVVKENQQMVSEYFNLTGHNSGIRHGKGGFLALLQLGESSQTGEDYEMTGHSSEDIPGESVSPNESIQNSGFLSSTTTSMSDDRNSADSTDKKGRFSGNSSHSPNATISAEANQGPGNCPDTPTSRKENEVRDDKEQKFLNNEEGSNKDGELGSAKYGQVFSVPLANINLEAEQSAMQQQIVDMYMRSMQQFTESLAKMKLPMDLDKPDSEDSGGVIQNHNKNSELDNTKKMDQECFMAAVHFSDNSFLHRLLSMLVQDILLTIILGFLLAFQVEFTTNAQLLWYGLIFFYLLGKP